MKCFEIATGNKVCYLVLNSIARDLPRLLDQSKVWFDFMVFVQLCMTVLK